MPLLGANALTDGPLRLHRQAVDHPPHVAAAAAVDRQRLLHFAGCRRRPALRR